MTEIADLVQLRGRIKARLSTFRNFLENVKKDSGKRDELPSRLEKVESLWSEYEGVQGQIEGLDSSEIQTKERCDFEDIYHSLVTQAKKLCITESSIETTSPTASPSLSQPVSQSGLQSVYQPAFAYEQPAIRPAVKLPSIDLPKFNGNYDQWVLFRDLFDALIHRNETITAVQKLYYLRASVTGEAAKVIDTLEISNDNYESAWNLLKQRFENKKLIIYNVLQILLSMSNVVKDSHVDLRRFVDGVNQQVQTLSKLGQPVNHWDTLLIYNLLPKLDKESHKEWESSRTDNDDLPTLKEFLDFLSKRCTFLEAMTRSNQGLYTRSGNIYGSHKPANKNVSHVCASAHVSTCSICNNNHKIIDCQKFRNFSVAERITEVKRKRLCIKCLKGFHGRNCKSLGCRVCKGYHHALLHLPRSTRTPVNTYDPTTPSSNEETGVSSEPNQQSALSGHSSDVTQVSLSSHNTNNQVLLSTAIVLVRD